MHQIMSDREIEKSILIDAMAFTPLFDCNIITVINSFIYQEVYMDKQWYTGKPSTHCTRSIGTKRFGNLHGTFTHYLTDSCHGNIIGKLRQTCFVDGVQTGMSFTWRQDGTLETLTNTDTGDHSEYHKDGKTLKTKYRIITVNSISDDADDADDEETIQSLPKYDGPYKEYFDNGALRSEATYINGQATVAENGQTLVGWRRYYNLNGETWIDWDRYAV